MAKQKFTQIEVQGKEIIDKETGEMTPLKKIVVLPNDQWLRLYAESYAKSINGLSGCAIKLFSLCMKYAGKDFGKGNEILTNYSEFKDEVKTMKLASSIDKYMKELVANGLIVKISRGRYILNPSVAYLGDDKSRVRLIEAQRDKRLVQLVLETEFK